MTVPDARPAGARESDAGAVGYECPECSRTFSAGHPRAIFCCEAHRRDFHRRAEVRGRQLLPFAMANYLTRGGSRGDVATGKRARADAEFLIRQWKDEDAASGRMSILAYVARRYALGYDRP